MITVTVELSLDTAAKLAHCASEHKRAVVDEALFILSRGGSTYDHLFPATRDNFILSRGGSTQSKEAYHD